MLSPDTQAILLLFASFGQRQTEPKPLTLGEYNTLASWLLEQNLTPADLLNATVEKRLTQITIAKLDSERLIALLKRGVMLSLSLEKWTNQGLWLIGRGEIDYPKRFKQKLKQLAPPILYGVGQKKLLYKGGLAIVGSRDVDTEGLNYTQKVVQMAAKQDIQVISGAARGVDQAAMLGILEAGGTSIGVLADSLTKLAVHGKYRNAIKEGKLTLVSAYDPDAGFSIGSAMGRNKYIYALSDYALIISSSVNTGGTWTGAVEALEKIKDVPIFVRTQGDLIPEGNLQLLERGAKPFPEDFWHHSQEQPNLTTPISLESQNSYEAVLPLILQHLEEPKNAKSLAQCLDIQLSQLQIWLNRAVLEGKIQKNKKPVTYEIDRQGTLL